VRACVRVCVRVGERERERVVAAHGIFFG
jgi:hypothetical protein